MNIAMIPHVTAHLLKQNGLAQQGWTFAWDNAKRRAGCCKYRTKRITLSKHYVALNLADNEEDVIDTILHEIAHALTPNHMHDDTWKTKCVEIGANPVRCYDTSVVKMPNGRWQATCRRCGRKFYRHKAVKRGYYHSCPDCRSDHNNLARLTFRDTTIAGASVPTATRTTSPTTPQRLE